MGPQPPKDGRRHGDDGGPVHRIGGSDSLAAFLDLSGEELHFLVAIWVIGWR
jgi:hypothetical protein